jgi:hypothetical protein
MDRVALTAGFRAIARGFGYITLDPSSRLRALRERTERHAEALGPGPLPPLPESAYTPEGALLEPQEWPPARGDS